MRDFIDQVVVLLPFSQRKRSPAAVRLAWYSTVTPLIHVLGGFDLIVGGSPCNNLTGSNRSSSDGLGGIHSILFYDYSELLTLSSA
ncbi:hypothetical protein FRX31_006874 [Thalictrum thalictroides]|uniref:Uncharacterized protein n=1 Tax=Thalictrum thalictroides TaxID=46969 RepID=A0A7J6X4Q1_THATH|nr:hypothetical protein FRX31_006874 [Thalictrum thalictroides]